MNWRVVDLLELGDMGAARRAIDAHGRLADDLRLLAYAWYRPMWLAMLALLAGRLDEAWRLSAEGARIGRAANDENARVLFEVQSTTIKVAQGRPLVATDRAAAERGARRPAGGAWRAWLAMLAFDRGDTARASRLVADETARSTHWRSTPTGCTPSPRSASARGSSMTPRLRLPCIRGSCRTRNASPWPGAEHTAPARSSFRWDCSPPLWATTSAPSVI